MYGSGTVVAVVVVAVVVVGGGVGVWDGSVGWSPSLIRATLRPSPLILSFVNGAHPEMSQLHPPSTHHPFVASDTSFPRTYIPRTYIPRSYTERTG